jgi:hypothetical protein
MLISHRARRVMPVTEATQVGRVESSMRCIAHTLDVIDIGCPLTATGIYARWTLGEMLLSKASPIPVIPALVSTAAPLLVLPGVPGAPPP